MNVSPRLYSLPRHPLIIVPVFTVYKYWSNILLLIYFLTRANKLNWQNTSWMWTLNNLPSLFQPQIHVQMLLLSFQLTMQHIWCKYLTHTDFSRITAGLQLPWRFPKLWDLHPPKWYADVTAAMFCIQLSATSVSANSVLWRCPVRVSCEGVLCGCSVRVLCEGVLWGCPARVFCDGVLRGCSVRLFCEVVLWGCSVRVSCEGVL